MPFVTSTAMPPIRWTVSIDSGLVLRSYLPILVFVGLGILVGTVFALSTESSGRKGITRKMKADPYECGLPSEVSRTFRFGISFYMIAMLFILFDIEVVFLYPVGVILNGPTRLRPRRGPDLRRPAAGRADLRLATRRARMEIVRREKLRGLAPLAEPDSPEHLRIRQLRARDLLRGDLADADLEEHVNQSVYTGRLEDLLNWARANSCFPMTFGLACCAMEMIAVVGSPRNDLARFGAEALRASPRQADLIILSGRVSIKMAPVVRRLYDQMLEPRWAISMGACSSSGGMFANYAVVQGADKFMPIDVHVPGCPPRPEALTYGFNKLQRMIQGNPDMGWRRRYNAEGTEEWARDDVIAGQPSEAGRYAAHAAVRL